jgi:adenylate cyclase
VTGTGGAFDGAGGRPCVVVNPGGPGERIVEVRDRLFIGRECQGIDDAHRLLVDDPSVSRHHLEIRVEADQGRAVVVDSSTNGTYLDGSRLERAHPTVLPPGSLLTIGATQLEFRSAAAGPGSVIDTRATLRPSTAATLVMAVGDIVDYTGLAERAGAAALGRSIDDLFAVVHRSLRHHRGSLANYAGDAFFGVWEPARIDDAGNLAVSFAMDVSATLAPVAAAGTGRAAAPSGPDGSPLCMGWGVVVGEVSVGPMPGGMVAVLGDAANLAFRLAGVAGRGGHGPVLVSDDLCRSIGPAPGLVFGEPYEVTVKGRQEPARVRSVGPA